MERLKLTKGLCNNLFQELKQNTNSNSIRELSNNLNINYNTLKQWARGKLTIPISLLRFLSKNKANEFLSKGLILNGSWESSKGGKITNYKIKQGIIKRSPKAIEGIRRWHRNMKKKNGEEYSKTQRQRWVALLKIFKENKELRSKAQKTLLKRHGKDFYKRIGNKGAENAKLNRLELKVKKQKIKSVTPKFHKEIVGYNIDIIYFKDNKIVALEEVVGLKKKKSLMFYDIAKIEDKIEKIQPTVHFIISIEDKNKNWKSPRKFHPDLARYLLDIKIVPIILNNKSFLNIKKDLIHNKNPNISQIKKYLDQELIKRNKYSRAGAISEKNKNFIETEEKIRDILSQKVELSGKRILKTKYGSYFVSDESSKNTVYFFSKKGFRELIGYGFMVKKLINKNLKVIGVLLEKDKRVTQRDIKLVNKYVDKVYWDINELIKEGPID